VITAHLFSLHDYDDVAARVWHDGATISLDRTGLISWSWFNSAPSHFCTEGGEQTFAEFLEGGPLKGEGDGGGEGAPASQATMDEVRAHLLARKPGTSTYITLDSTRSISGWGVDGVFVHARAIAGPESAGYGTWRNVPGHALLVAPGTHRVEVTFHGGAAPVAQDVTIQRAEHVALTV
jgi:hypothetical protein